MLSSIPQNLAEKNEMWWKFIQSPSTQRPSPGGSISQTFAWKAEIWWKHHSIPLHPNTYCRGINPLPTIVIVHGDQSPNLCLKDWDMMKQSFNPPPPKHLVQGGQSPTPLVLVQWDQSNNFLLEMVNFVLKIIHSPSTQRPSLGDQSRTIKSPCSGGSIPQNLV